MVNKYYIIKCKNGQKKNGVQYGGLDIVNKLKLSYIDVPYDNRKNILNQSSFIINSFDTSLLNKNITFGGDHSISLCTIQHSINKYGIDNTFVIWIDAHTDINSIKTSPSGNFHGMPLNYLTGLTKHKNIKKNLKFNNQFYIGTRSIDSGELEYIRENKINNYTMDVIRKTSIKQVIKNIKSKITELCDNPKIHISFDVDCISPEYVSSTGTPVDNGLTPNEVKYIFNNLDNVVAIDICEYNPYLGNKELSIKNIIKSINPILN